MNLCSSTLLLTAALAALARADDVAVLSFFRDNGQDGIFLAASDDGLVFTALNNDRPVMKPANWPGQNLTRDPSIVFRDGKFRAVWTSGWKGPFFGYAESSDLIHWSEPVKVRPFPESLPKEGQPRNVWAPEIHWDPARKDYAIIWSSTIERESRDGDGSSMDGKDGAWDHRMFITRTADGRQFTDAQVFFDPPYCCIDGMMAFDGNTAGGRWVMIFKNEQEIRLGGKNLRVVSAPSGFSAPWSEAGAPVAGPGSNLRPKEMAEGPSLLRWRDTWFLYWDAFANGRYCLATSTNLRDWTDRTAELRMPAHPRHGTVFHAPREIVAALRGK